MFLEEVKSNQLTAFSSAFSSFLSFRIIYNQNQKRLYFKQSFNVFCIDRKTEFNKKIYRDNISSESINYKQMFKY